MNIGDRVRVEDPDVHNDDIIHGTAIGNHPEFPDKHAVRVDAADIIEPAHRMTAYIDGDEDSLEILTRELIEQGDIAGLPWYVFTDGERHICSANALARHNIPVEQITAPGELYSYTEDGEQYVEFAADIDRDKAAEEARELARRVGQHIIAADEITE